MDSVGDVMSDDEVVLCLHGALNVVANGSCRFARPLHRASVRIGQRDLRVFRLFQLRLNRLHALNFLLQPVNLALEPGALDFGRRRLAVGGFKLG